MIQRFQNKTCLVTGGTRGIGEAIVRRFSAEGAAVVFTYARNHDLADKLVSELENTSCLQCDGSQRDEIQALLARLKDSGRQVDVLVNNAGITANMYLPMTSDEDWNRVLQTNVTAVFNWTREVVRSMMMRRAGVIVNIASVSGLFGVPGQSAYGASKGALLAFTRAVAAETGEKGIRVNAVVPGFISTEMTAKIPRQYQRKYIDRIGMKRFGSVEEVAGAVSFLASDDASYITGQTLIVDGGLTAVVG